MKNKKLSLYDILDIRFHGAKFRVSCFKTIDEIENKKLTDDNLIIVRDLFEIRETNTKTKKTIETKFYDYFVVQSSNNDGIYHKDVIDQLIKSGFDSREKVNHKYLEGIGKIKEKQMNKNSIPLYGIGWGS